MSTNRPAPEVLGDDGYRTVFMAAPDGILIVDEEGRIRDSNPAVERIFGYGPEDLVGQAVELLVPDELRTKHTAHRKRYAEDPHPRPMGIGMELRGLRRDGTTVPVEISLSPLRRDGNVYVIATVRDVSQRKRLQRFGTGTLRAAEEERRRLARELHDDTAQQLASALIRLRVALGTDSEDRRKEILESVREQILRTAEGVRRIARGLRPPALEDVGLLAAVRAHLRNLEDATGIDLVLEDDLAPSVLDDGLDENGKLVLYRIVQEALSNAVRHSEADRVVVRLESRDGRLRVEVVDGGRGFDRHAVDASEDAGLGLISMQERAAIAGGSLKVESEPGRGTRVRVELPLSAKGDADG